MNNTSELAQNTLQDHFVEMSIVIPALNEEANVSLVIEESIQVLNQKYGENKYELILVNDGSIDGTGHICDNLAQQYQQVHVFHHPTNQGFGAALKTGFINARGQFVSFIPADGQVTIDQMIKLYDEIGDADIIVSARENYQTIHGKKFRSIYRKYLTSALRHLLILIFGFDQSGKEGIFVIRNDVLQRLRLTSKTGLLMMEVIMQCYRNDYSVKKSTISVQPRISGQSKVTTLSTYLKYFWEIGKLRIKG